MTCRLCFKNVQVDNNDVCADCNKGLDEHEENESEERAIERRFDVRDY